MKKFFYKEFNIPQHAKSCSLLQDDTLKNPVFVVDILADSVKPAMMYMPVFIRKSDENLFTKTSEYNFV